MGDLIEYYKNREELPDTLSGCLELINLLYAKIEQLEEVLWAKDQLLVCYRLGGRRPTDKVMRILDEWDELKKLEGKNE